MKTRASRLAAVLTAGLLVLCVFACLSGCQRSTTASRAAEQQQDPNALVLQQIKLYQEETGKNLAALADEIKRQQSLQASQAGDPPLVRDLAVARFLLGDARKAAEAKNAESMGPALKSLKRVVVAMNAELPGSLIAQRVDRAVYQIRNQQAVGSREFASASLELLAAADAAGKGRPAAAVPEVLKDLESAKSAVDKAAPAEALQTLAAVLDKITTHPIAGSFARALASLRGAEDALGRFAWPVVAAEMAELDNILSALSDTLSPQTAASAAKAEPKTEAAQSPAQVPAATPATGAATSAVPAPAATTAPAQVPAATSTVPAPAPAQAPAAQPVTR